MAVDRTDFRFISVTGSNHTLPTGVVWFRVENVGASNGTIGESGETPAVVTPDTPLESPLLPGKEFKELVVGPASTTLNVTYII